ncbi:MAG: ester cyclase [Candidatus Limnocylindrales bacterium]
MRREALIRTYWERCWNARDVDLLGAVFHDPYLHNGTPATPGEHAEIIADTVRSFPDFRVLIDDVTTAGAAVITRCTFLGTHGGEVFGLAATDRPIRAPSLDVYFFRGAKVERLWHVTDHLPILKRLGDEIRVDGTLADLA